MKLCHEHWNNSACKPKENGTHTDERTANPEECGINKPTQDESHWVKGDEYV